MKLYLNKDNTKGFIFHNQWIEPSQIICYGKSPIQHFREMLIQNNFSIGENGEIILKGETFYSTPLSTLSDNDTFQLTVIRNYNVDYGV